MIEGLKIEITSDELRVHILARAEHHRERATFYEAQVSNLRAGGLTAERGVSNDPVGSLNHSATQHRNKTAFFAFLAEHLVPGETYRLTENDLERLEIFSRYL
jgi:hypothetical protein